MENIQDIIIPGFPIQVEEEVKEKKKVKKILDVRERLPRTNREIKCIFCEQEKILNPDQYQAYYDYWGSEEKVEKEFFCKPCDVLMKENPIKFWFLKDSRILKLMKNLRTAFDLYRISSRGPNDAVTLQTMSVGFLKECNISDNNFEFIIQNQLPVAMKIKNIPFVGDLQLNVYANNITQI